MDASLKTVVIILVNVLFISAVIFYYFGAAKNVTERVIYSQSEKASEEILDSANSVYYSGGSAKRNIPFEMPGAVDSIYASKENKLYFSVKTNSSSYTLDFKSSVPLLVLLNRDDIQNNTVIVEKQDDYVVVCSGITCNCLKDGTLSCD